MKIAIENRESSDAKRLNLALSPPVALARTPRAVATRLVQSTKYQYSLRRARPLKVA